MLAAEIGNPVTQSIFYYVTLMMYFGYDFIFELKNTKNIIEKGVYGVTIIVILSRIFVNLGCVSCNYSQYIDFVNSITLDKTMLMVVILGIITSLSLWLLRYGLGKFTSL